MGSSHDLNSHLWLEQWFSNCFYWLRGIWRSYIKICRHTAILKMAVFWVVAPCSLVEVYRRFRGACCRHYQGRDKRFFVFRSRTSNWRWGCNWEIKSAHGQTDVNILDVFLTVLSFKAALSRIHLFRTPSFSLQICIFGTFVLVWRISSEKKFPRYSFSDSWI
jgi:hypothetical protein